MKKCDVKGLAIGIGITWGLYMMFLGWISTTGWGAEWVDGLSTLYVGFTSSFVGGIIGGLWGFLDGFIGGALIAYFYNLSVKKD